MVFSSQVFLFWFLPLALLLYHAARRGPRGAGHAALVAASYVFYGWSDPRFVLLLVATTLVGFACALVIERGARRTGLALSLLANLGALAFFKYANLAADTLGLEVARIALPLGISFYTFQSLSYTIDVYRGHVRATRSLLDYACYLSLFSQLVAGPILRFSEVADQLVSRTHTLEKFARGVAMFALGLSKKVLLANPCGRVADACFDAGSLAVADAWVGVLAYSFQIYFDFSGYTDIAIGLGLMFGFVFPKNFDAPYRSESLSEFWRRWHISLSSWLRDYLYVPLGGNRKGPARTYANLMVVMLLGGLWHGASWTFLLWGGLHGAFLALERALGQRALWARLPRWSRVAATFLAVTLAWVPFRAPDFAKAGEYFGRLLGVGSADPGALLVAAILYQPYYLGTLLAAAAITWLGHTSWDWTRALDARKAAVCLILFAASAALLFAQAHNPFLYFVF